MSLLKGILTSDYLTLVQGLDNRENVNAVLNGDPPKSLLDIAIEADSENSTMQSKAIISLLRTKGALTYAAIQARQVAAPAAAPVPAATPVPAAAPAAATIQNAGIAGVGLPRRRVAPTVAAPLAAPLAGPARVTIKNTGIAGVGLPRRRVVNLSGARGGRGTRRRRLLRKSRRRRI
jgi:hypothetical protein